VQAYPCSCPKVGKLGHGGVAVRELLRRVAMATVLLARYLGRERGRARLRCFEAVLLTFTCLWQGSNGGPEATASRHGICVATAGGRRRGLTGGSRLSARGKGGKEKGCCWAERWERGEGKEASSPGRLGQGRDLAQEEDEEGSEPTAGQKGREGEMEPVWPFPFSILFSFSYISYTR
jgi:hypothetical protein